jgi:hypothetical protein
MVQPTVRPLEDRLDGGIVGHGEEENVAAGEICRGLRDPGAGVGQFASPLRDAVEHSDAPASAQQRVDHRPADVADTDEAHLSGFWRRCHSSSIGIGTGVNGTG